MRAAMEEAKEAQARGEVPIGAVIADCKAEKVLSAAGNRTIEYADPTAHAEILAIRKLCRDLGVQRIPGYSLYVTLEPCAMCAAALSFARLDKIIFAATDPKGGGVLHGGKFFEQPTCHHRPDVKHGLLAEESAALLKGFFKARR
ncbi:MAG: nucleoside deaminase [Alphaproteobacteria bacterium]|nr:nucleoside deaminase [Alphaproteobacteria bacterium]